MQRLDVNEISRKRSPNFTKKENRVLAELVQVYEELIECKKTDHVSNMGKIRAWQELANDFNARMGGDPYRSATVLKHRYDNIKKDIRRELRKKQTHQSSNNNQNEEVNPLEDTQNSGDIDPENEVDIKEIIRIKLMSDDTVDQDEFDNFIPSANEINTQNHMEPKADKLPETAVWTNNPTPEFEELRKNCFLEEHKLRLQHMKEKHNLEMDFMRLEHKERIKMLRQEHENRMELLELEKSVGIINKI